MTIAEWVDWETSVGDSLLLRNSLIGIKNMASNIEAKGKFRDDNISAHVFWTLTKMSEDYANLIKPHTLILKI